MSTKYGFKPEAVLLDETIERMREHVEYEKYIARTIRDDETTRQFEENTKNHPNSKWNFIYNNKAARSHKQRTNKADKAKLRGNRQDTG